MSSAAVENLAPNATPWWQRLRREGAWFTLLLVGVTALLYGDLLWRFDRLLYDTAVRVWYRPTASDIVIIAIDEKSLTILGQFPWSRRVHAQLIAKLSQHQVKGIAFDIAFVEPSRNDPESDRQLAAAVRANGRVVLPVVNSQWHNNGQLIELLPLPALVAAAYDLGHVDIGLDHDGVARYAFLYAGIGAPHWPHFSLALLQLEGQSAAIPPSSDDVNPFVWRRADPVLVPFAGPAGHFTQLSYIDVLQSQFPPDALRNKFVFVGVTAHGLGDTITTPVADAGAPMAGVEFNAHLFDALRRGLTPSPLEWRYVWLLSVLTLLAPWGLHGCLYLRRLTPYSMASVALTAGLLLISSVALLRFGLLWFPPSVALVGLLTGHLLSSRSRLSQLERVSHRDELTQLLSRRPFEQALLRWLRLLERRRKPLALLLIDIDHFKEYNALYGRQRGDETLRKIALALEQFFLSSDALCARYGDDEFVIALRQRQREQVVRQCEHLRRKIERLAIPHLEAPDSPILTISIGVITVAPTAAPIDALALLRQLELTLAQSQQRRSAIAVASYSPEEE